MKDFVKVEQMPQAISNFLGKARIATVCFVDRGAPHCINCFFAFDPLTNFFVFKSRRGSGHDDFVFSGEPVGGTVLPDVLRITGMQGLQFKGETLPEKSVKDQALQQVYAERFPFTRLLPGYTWAVRPLFLKFTDNSKGFGQKTLWTPSPENALATEKNI